MTRPYHHGDLREALLAAAETILETEGLPALTLRAAARAVGVSHAAPANHFGDMTGLLSELAAVGYQRFGAALATAMDAAGPDPRLRFQAMGRAYVGFARAHPGLFVLMFRSERLDASRPALRAAIDASREALRQAISARSTAPAGPLQMAAQAAAYWSLVHGFAVLLLDGRLNGMIKALPGPADADDLLEAMLTTVTLAG
ncbi:TetR/AcrR family transcriptional regulator [Humitalea sp. 24SJ18S-53]|uniref:TetR/AcrR family transcriptional regulator n=1 Tax=Humitalea sp. 24SJ18S-53 TaxID=3422307 RepID=UPI003D6699D7